ncbi:uncharacterized protein [Littorina saxatilis]|uniref:uncharacterized protein n=1 Tax=Littorina saxatilis TaxID=31220 RepID=UPI0038B4FDD3
MRICSQKKDFAQQCHQLEQAFRLRGYKKKTLEEAKERAGATPRSEALAYKEKSTNNRVPFVITHNHANPPLREWLKENQEILHSSTRMKEAVPELPVVGERNAKSLKHMIMPTVLPPALTVDSDSGVAKCGKTCIICKEHLTETKTFTSASTREHFEVRHRMSCTSSNIIYTLYCNKCDHAQYIGETKNSLKTRFYLHRSHIPKHVVQTGNLAKGKPSNQSSLYSANEGHSRLAVDGNRNQSYYDLSCTHTLPDPRPHWWQVDLEQAVTVTAVVLYNRGDCCGDRLKDFAVEVGVPDQDGQVEYRNCSFHSGPANSIVNTTCWTSLCGRYVRVIKQDDDAEALTLCEVEVFGSETSCTTGTADGTSTLTDQRVTMTTNGQTATSPPTMSSDNPSPATTQEATYPTTDDFATPSESILSTQKRETLTPQKETTPFPTEVSSTPDTLDGPTTLPTQPVASSTVGQSSTWASASSSVQSSTVPTQETSPSMTNVSAESASATSTHELTTLTPHNPGSSTADVITPGSMTSQETSTPQETGSSAADVVTPSSMTSQETSPEQQTGSSTADVTTPYSMTSQETSTQQETGSSTADVTTPDLMTSQETSTQQETGSSTADVVTSGLDISRETSTPQETANSKSDVVTPGSTTSQETLTQQETDSSTADLTTSGSMTSQKTGGPTTDVTTTGSMTSQDTSTSRESATATHVNSTQTRNPYAPGNVRETLPTKHAKCCRCVFLVSSNVTEQTITAVEKTMKEVRMSLLVNRTQVGKSIRKKTSAGDERTSSKTGGFAAVVILTSVFAFFLVLDCLGCIRGCASNIKRSNATSPSSREP